MPAQRPQTATTRTGVDRRAMATLSAGHLFTDVGQGSVPALLPFLIVKDHLSYAGASALILAATIASSVIQPVFGHLSDRRSLPWLMPHRSRPRRLGRRAGRRRAHLRAHLRRRRGQRDRRRRLPSRGLALCQLRLRRAALERHEPVQRGGQRRLRAGTGAGDAAGARLRPLGDAAGDRAHDADGVRARPRATAPEDLPRRPGHEPGATTTDPTPGVRSLCSRGHRACARSSTSASSPSSRCTSSTTCTRAAAPPGRR